MKIEFTDKERHILKVALQCLADVKLGLLIKKDRATSPHFETKSPFAIPKEVAETDFVEVLQAFSRIRSEERRQLCRPTLREDMRMEKALFDITFLNGEDQ